MVEGPGGFSGGHVLSLIVMFTETIFIFQPHLCSSSPCHMFGSMFISSDPVESRGRLRGQLEDLHAGGGRVTGSEASGHQVREL